jgi:hypothetical protein
MNRIVTILFGDRYVDAGVVLGGRHDCIAEMWLEEMELLL